MQRRSPPQHRHDGTSPLPLGMDWSPPPREWNGRDTLWPHDHRTGWSYCVTIPSWVILPKSRDSDPIVFYRVQIGVQSPEGITSVRIVLRRFNEFLNLFSDLKKSFPKKTLPPAPPKGLLRLKSRILLEERRSSIEEWMTKLLSDIDLSRSVVVAAFLELEAAARASFQDANEQQTEAKSPISDPNAFLQATSLLPANSSSFTSEYGSDTPYEASDLSTRDEILDGGVEELSLYGDLTNPFDALVKYGMSNIDEGLFMGQTILDQLEGIPRHKSQFRHVNNAVEKVTQHGNISKASYLTSNGSDVGHTRKHSSESNGSDASSLKGSEISVSGALNTSGDSTAYMAVGNEILGSESENAGDSHLLLPADQKQRMNRVLLTMQRRLATAKTDMVDLLSRLNQETTVKEYLASKVKDLEVELEVTRQKNKENLQQVIVIEREKLTQMQWDMEELRRKSLEMELKLKAKESSTNADANVNSSTEAKCSDSDDVEMYKRQLENITKQYEALEAKSKADMKFLAKEFKSLKASHTEMKQDHSRLQEERSSLEKRLKREEDSRRQERTLRDELLRDCRALFRRLQEEEEEERILAIYEFVEGSESRDELRKVVAEIFIGCAKRMNAATVSGASH